MKLYIRNMVCPRCIKAVEQILLNAEAKPMHIQLGEVLLQNPLSTEQLKVVSTQLQQLGFELLDDNHQQQIDKIKGEYAEVYQRTWDAFKDHDILCAAFMYSPMAFGS